MTHKYWAKKGEPQLWSVASRKTISANATKTLKKKKESGKKQTVARIAQLNIERCYKGHSGSVQALHTSVHRDKAYLKHLKTTFHCHPTHNMLECVYNVKLAGSDNVDSSDKGVQGTFVFDL